jgi:hypothetical protein
VLDDARCAPECDPNIAESLPDPPKPFLGSIAPPVVEIADHLKGKKTKE